MSKPATKQRKWLFISLTIILLASLSNTYIVFGAYPDSYTLGVKPGDWAEYSYKSNSPVSGSQSFDKFLRMTIIEPVSSKSGSISINCKYFVSMGAYPDGTISGSASFSAYDNYPAIGYSIPIDSKVGDNIITGYATKQYSNHDGFAKIDRETTGNYGGSSRTILHAKFSITGTDFERFYDKQTGFMVEETKTNVWIDETFRLVSTNMWSPTSSSADRGPDNQTLLIIILAVVIILVIVIGARKRSSRKKPHFEPLDTK